MSTFILCPEPGISSFFRRMTAQLRVFFSRNNLSYYSRWYTNPARQSERAGLYVPSWRCLDTLPVLPAGNVSQRVHRMVSAVTA